MIKKILLIIFILLLTVLKVQSQGYYKDVFINGGVGLSYFTLPSMETLGLSWEFLNTEDAYIQSQLFISNSNDQNGVLLYPDGQPRFRIFYCHGGSSTNHGYSLGDTGLMRIRAFYNNGGSYVGNCAGSALFSSGRDNQPMSMFFCLWPGWVRRVTVGPIWTSHVIPTNSKLLQYRNFGGDFKIDSLYFNYSNYAMRNYLFPPETDTMLIYNTPGYEMNGQISSYAYKKSDSTGRGAVVGCHSEFISQGDGLQLSEAIFLYALDGLGIYRLKGTLEKGVPRVMDKNTNENMPDYTKIGDKQYHHFKVNIPSNSKNLIFTLDGQNGFNFNMYVNRDSFAYRNHSIKSDTTNGSEKTITITYPSPGYWYLGVECNSTVNTVYDSSHYIYTSNLEVLNGLAYTVTANWESSIGISKNEIPVSYSLSQNYPNPFNPNTIIRFQIKDTRFVSLKVYDILGKEVASLVNEKLKAGTYEIPFSINRFTNNQNASGIYFYKLETEDFSETMKMILMK